jgi:SAM-dependent methyltransferase
VQLPEELGTSLFNYDDYTAARFLHYFQQLKYVLDQRPRSVLEVGPGDHTVTDMLRRKGIDVETYDSDEQLRPTYTGDVRMPLRTPRNYDLVLASEVLEHLPLRFLLGALQNFAAVLNPGGVIVVSLPYSTVRLFPPRPDYGRFVSCEGRVHTGIPVRVAYRLLHPFRGQTVVQYDDNRFDVHHWDLGFKGSSRRQVRRMIETNFDITDERAHRDTNCVFYVLRSRV